MSILSVKTDTHKPQLLILTFSYAPMRNPRSFRWTALAEEFASRGLQVQVVCSWQPGLAKQQNLNGVKVYRVGNQLTESFRASLAQIRSNSHPTLNTQPTSGSKASVGKLISWFWRQIAWPDTTCVWYNAAKRQAETLLQKNSETTVVSVSPSFTPVLVGRAITKQNAVRWIIDMGDPFSIAEGCPPNNLLLYKSLNKRVEHTLFQNADAVTLTNKQVLDRYGSMYPDCANKMYVIPPLLSDTIFRLGMKSNKRSPGEPVKLVFVGTLYKQLRQPEFLLELFEHLITGSRLHNSELHFYGNCEDCLNVLTRYKKRFGIKLQLHGVVSQQDSLSAVKSADVVVNLGNTNNCQLPSKLVEYAAMGAPIINIIRAENDPSEDFLKGYNAILNIRDSGMPPTDQQVGLAIEFIEKSINKTDNQFDNRWKKKFNKHTIADQYAAILFSV